MFFPENIAVHFPLTIKKIITYARTNEMLPNLTKKHFSTVYSLFDTSVDSSGTLIRYQEPLTILPQTFHLQALKHFRVSFAQLSTSTRQSPNARYKTVQSTIAINDCVCLIRPGLGDTAASSIPFAPVSAPAGPRWIANSAGKMAATRYNCSSDIIQIEAAIKRSPVRIFESLEIPLLVPTVHALMRPPRVYYTQTRAYLRGPVCARALCLKFEV